MRFRKLLPVLLLAALPSYAGKPLPPANDLPVKDIFLTRIIEDVITLTPGTTVTLDAALGNVFKLTPAQDCTINLTNRQEGRRVLIEIITSGGTSYTITFGTNFTSAGTLATGTVTAKTFLLEFYDDGANVIETSRSGPESGTVTTPSIAPPLTLVDPANLASTTFQFGNTLFGVPVPELEIRNSNPASGGFKWNVLALRALSEDQYTGITFRSPDGREHGAFGYGNTGTDLPFLGNSYFEASFFPFSGTTKPAGLLLAQSGYMGGSLGSRRRLLFDADGFVDFYKTDGSTKMFSLDTVNNYFAIGSGGSFATNVSGMSFGVVADSAQILRITSTANHAGILLDANGSGKAPFVDFFYDGTKKADVYWDNVTPRLLINDQGTATTLNTAGGAVTLGSAASAVNVPSLGTSLNVCTDGSGNLTTTGCTAGGATSSYYGSMVQVAQVVASGSSSTVTFSGIPGGYTDLIVLFVARDTNAANSKSFAVQMNGDTTAGNYVGGRYENVDSGGVTTGSTTAGSTGILGVDFPAGNSPASTFGQGQILLAGYSNASIFKRVSWVAEMVAQTEGTTEGLRRASGYWKSTSVITSLVFTTNGTNFVAGSTFTLYGLGGTAGTTAQAKVLFTQTASVTIANTVTETTTIGAGTGSVTLAGNSLAVGREIEWKLAGTIANTATPTLRIRMKAGSTVILDTGAVAMATLTGTQLLACSGVVTARTIGGAGTVFGQGECRIGGTVLALPMVNTSTASFDMTASQALSSTVEWGTANSSNTTTATNQSFVAMN